MERPSTGKTIQLTQHSQSISYHLSNVKHCLQCQTKITNLCLQLTILCTHLLVLSSSCISFSLHTLDMGESKGLSISTGSSSSTVTFFTCDMGNGVGHGWCTVHQRRDSGVLYQMFATPEIIEWTQSVSCSVQLKASTIGIGFQWQVQSKLTMG